MNTKKASLNEAFFVNLRPIITKTDSKHGIVYQETFCSP